MIAMFLHVEVATKSVSATYFFNQYRIPVFIRISLHVMHVVEGLISNELWAYLVSTPSHASHASDRDLTDSVSST